MDSENTIFFKVEKEKKTNSKQILRQVYEALVEKGYNPINQIVGYILSGDPTYITSYKDSRKIIEKIEIVGGYLNIYINKDYIYVSNDILVEFIN